MLQTTITYIGQSALQTVLQLLAVLGPVLALAVALQLISGYVRGRAARIIGVNFYTYLTAPGVICHELGHAIFCILFGHRIVRMQLFSPSPDGTLGSVEHAYNPRNAYQRIGNFFIGTGPIWFGTAVIYLLARLLVGSAVFGSAGVTSSDGASGLAAMAPRVADSAWRLFTAMWAPSIVSTWQFGLFAYLVFCIGSHITLSRPDIDGAARGFVSLVLLVFLFNLLTLWLGGQFSSWTCQRLVEGCAVFYGATLFVICLNLCLAAILFALSTVTGRR